MLAKQLFLITSETLSAYQWERGRLSDPETFSNDRAGLDAFALYLRRDPVRPAYVIADAKPVSMRDVFAAFRKGLGRPQRLAAVPPAFLRLSVGLAGKSEAWQGIFADEICNPSALARTGWLPEQDSLGRLAAVARRMRGTPQR